MRHFQKNHLSIELEQQNADEGAEEEDADRTYFINLTSDEGEDKDGDGDVELPRRSGGGEVLWRHQQEAGGSKEADDGRTKTHKDVLHDRMVLILHQKLGDNQHEDERGQYDSESGSGRAENTHPMCATCVDNGGVAHVSGGVDANGAGCHLRDSHDIGKLAHCHPMVVRNNLTLNHRQHGIASTESEEANEEERIEKLEVDQIRLEFRIV